jgi:hypothetical protein
LALSYQTASARYITVWRPPEIAEQEHDAGESNQRPHEPYSALGARDQVSLGRMTYWPVIEMIEPSQFGCLCDG